MSGVTTDDGLEQLIKRSHDDTVNGIEAVAIGTGTSAVSTSDTSMENELHREAPENVYTTTTTGEREFAIKVTGGTEVAAGTDVTEFGLVSSTTSGAGTLIYHEVRAAITVSDGTTVEFIIPYNMARPTS